MFKKTETKEVNRLFKMLKEALKVDTVETLGVELQRIFARWKFPDITITVVVSPAIGRVVHANISRKTTSPEERELLAKSLESVATSIRKSSGEAV